MRARALLRLANANGAAAALQSRQGEAFRDRAELALLRAVSYSRLGDVAQSREAFADAHEYSISATDIALEAEVAFYQGLAAFSESSFDDGRAACRRALDVAKTPREFPGANGIVPLDHVVSRAQELLGVIDAAQGRYREQVPHARAALSTLQGCAIRDIFQEAFTIRNLAILARDFDLDDATTIVERVDALAWTEDISAVHFTTAEALGWCSALRGDPVAALRFFRTAGNAASTVPEQVYVGVARSVISRELNYRVMAAEELEHALRLAASFEWDEAAGDSRIALLFLAQAAAPIAPVGARQALDRYDNIGKRMDGRYAARVEVRVRAEEAYTHGVILRAEGRLDASTHRLRAAFESWDTIGYEWRAARAALELAELGAGDVFRLAVHRELRRRPESVFASRARRVA
ncbi:MAG: hypothetical protein M3R53_05530 [Candidatus Eremiobacteraeota bacterium]|nr:hypothetical protein [Candidatus Eremiobacteraeota bacterium]